MRKLLYAVLAATIVCGAEEKPLPVWRMPQVWPRHVQLRQQLIDVLRRSDAVKMEEICRDALKILPGDATWHYNLACALAQNQKPTDALSELERAIDFGFRDADGIAKDVTSPASARNPASPSSSRRPARSRALRGADNPPSSHPSSRRAGP
ncbi:MAG: hypothetical protein IJL17_03085 [Kiritimatiellae bacterium]|nr:hypothetical protein [Kiritimatiellia bacterium]